MTPPFLQRPRLPAVLFGILTALWFSCFAVLNVDLHHDGLMLQSAAASAAGQTLYRDIFCQHGALTVYLQGLALRIGGVQLIAIRLLTAGFYGAAAALLWLIWRRFLPARLLPVLALLCWGLAPALLVTFHPWPSVYALTFQLGAALALLNGLERRDGRAAFAVAGGCIAAVFGCRFPAGLALLAAVGLFAGCLACHREPACSAKLRELVWCFLTFAGLIGGWGIWLYGHGALAAAWRQSFVTGAEFAAERGGLWSTLPECLFPLPSFFALLPLAALAVLLIAVWRRNLPILLLALIGLGSWHQYYPVPCVRHLYWAAVPLFGLYLWLAKESARRFAGRRTVRLAVIVLLAAAPLPEIAMRLIGAGHQLAGIARRQQSDLEFLRGMRLRGQEKRYLEGVRTVLSMLPPELRDRPILNHTPDAIFNLLMTHPANPKPMPANWWRFGAPDYPERAAEVVRRQHPVVLAYRTAEDPDAPPFPGYRLFAAVNLPEMPLLLVWLPPAD